MPTMKAFELGTTYTFILWLTLLHPIRAPTGNVEALDWKAVWPAVRAGKCVLSEEKDWKVFLSAAEKHFGTRIFDAENTPYDFARIVVEETLGGHKDVPGLYEAQQILKYGELDFAGKSLDTNELNLKEINDKQAILNIMLIFKNLGLECPSSLVQQMKNGTPHFAKYEAILSDQDVFVNHAQCNLENVMDNVQLPQIANFFGDGAIDSEVDMDGKALEGAKSGTNACLIAQLAQQLLTDHASKEIVGLLDLETVRDKMLQAHGASQFLLSLGKLPNPYEIFEDAVIERLRTLNTGDYLLLEAGFTEHAMAVTIEKTGSRTFDLNVFNTGMGIEHHSRRMEGTKQKLFPAKRYTNITLLELKYSAVIQRMTQVLACGNYRFPNPENGKPASLSDDDFYIEALGVLKDFEYHFTSADQEKYRAISGQRSGTCSARAWLAYLAFHQRNNFRLLKLAMYRNLLDMSLGKLWPDIEQPVSNRILKFALENHSRSVLRFDERENHNPKLDIAQLLPSDMWTAYDRVKELYSEPKASLFKVDLVSARPSKEFYEEIMNQAGEIEDEFTNAKWADNGLKPSDSADCNLASAAVFGQKFDRSTFGEYSKSLLYFTSFCVPYSTEQSSIDFLTTTVMHIWPDPDDALWTEILDPSAKELELSERNMSSLFDLVRRILEKLARTEQATVHIYATFHKILTIYQQAFGVILPKITSCNTRWSPFSQSSAKYLNLSPKVANYFRTFQVTAGEGCIDGNEFIGSFLSDFVDKLATKYGQEYLDCDMEFRKMLLFSERRDAGLPAIMYYWRMLAKIVFHLEKWEYIGWNVYFPESLLPLDPFNDKCRVYNSQFTCQSDQLSYGDLIISPSHPCFGPRPLAVSLEEPIEAGNGLTLLEATEAEEPIFKIILASTNNHFEYYMHLFDEKFDLFNWASTLYLGVDVIYGLDLKTEALDKDLPLTRQKTSQLWREILKEKASLCQAADQNPMLKKRVSILAALVILESSLCRLMGMTGVGERLDSIFQLLSESDIHGSFSVFFSFAYLASIEPAKLPDPKVAQAMRIYQKLSTTIDQLPSAIDKFHYGAHVRSQAVQLVYRLASIESKELLSECLPPGSGDLDMGNFSTLLTTSKDHSIDLLSGSVYVKGVRTSDISRDELIQYYKKAGIKGSIESYRFEKITHQISGGYELITGFVQPGSMRVDEGTTIGELTKLCILVAGDKAFVKEIYLNADTGTEFAGLCIADLDASRLPIPAPVDSEQPYNVIAFPREDKVLFRDRADTIWAHGGMVSFADSKLKDLKFFRFTDENSVTSPIAKSNEVLAFWSPRDSTHMLMLRNYSDSSNMSLWFIYSGNNWHYLNDQKYFVSEEQEFSSSSSLMKHLLLENGNGQQKLILPIEHYQRNLKKPALPIKRYQRSSTAAGNEPASALLLDQKYANNRKQYLTFSLSSQTKHAYDEYIKGKLDNTISSEQKLTSNLSGQKSSLQLDISPSSRIEALLLCYTYLITRRYSMAFSMLRNVHQMEPLGGEELRLLGWIHDSNFANRDGSPDSIAVRAYAAFLVYANGKLFQHLSRQAEATSIKNVNEPYMSSTEWKSYWSGERSRGDVVGTVEQYVRRKEKVSSYLRFDVGSGRQLLSRFEERTWYKSLSKSASTLLNLQLSPASTPLTVPPSYENRSTPRKITFSYDDAIQCAKTIQDTSNNALEYSADKISYIRPSQLDSERQETFCKILARNYDQDAKAKYTQFLEGARKVPEYSLVASTLLNAFLRPEEEYTSSLADFLGKCQPVPERRLEARKNCAESAQRLLASFEGMNQREYDTLNEKVRSEPHLRQPDMIAEYNDEILELRPKMSVQNIPDNIFGVAIDLGSLKASLLRGEEAVFTKECDRFVQHLRDKLEPAKDIISAQFLSLIDRFEAAHPQKTVYQTIQTIRRLFKAYHQALFKRLLERSSANRVNLVDQLLPKLSRLAKGETYMTSKDFIHLYAQSSPSLYKQYLPNYSGDFSELHQLAAEYVLALTNCRDLRRLQKAFKNKEENPSELETELKERVRFTKTEQTAMLAYEYYIDSRLTEQQVKDIKTFTKKDANGKYPHKIIQRIMSAGKTYILGTLLAVMKADYEYMSILVVPKALFTGEASSLISRTMSAFGRDGFSFNVSREYNQESEEAMLWIANKLKFAAQSGRYVILPPEPLSTLQNKFIELEHDPVSRPELKSVRSILGLFRDKGAATVDEAPKVFDPPQETNFPLQNSVHVNDESSTLILEAHVLCQVFQALQSSDVRRELHGLDIRTNIPLAEKDFDLVKNILGAHMVDRFLNGQVHLPSELSKGYYDFLQVKTREGWKHDLLNFLCKDSNIITANEIQAVKDNVPLNVFRTLSVFRMAVTSWVNLAWSGNVNENYGLSPTGKYSIPFYGPFAPKLLSEFSFRWFCYARTIRTYMVAGFDERTLKLALEWLQKWALREVSKQGTNGNSIPERLFRELFNLSAFELDLSSNVQLKQLLAVTRRLHSQNFDALGSVELDAYNQFLFTWIAEDVIPSVTFYLQQISTNAQDFTYMFASIQGYAGMFPTVRILPKFFLEPGNIELDPTVGPKIRARITEQNNFEAVILEDGLTAEEFISATSVQKAIKEMSEQYKSPLVAVADVGAYFKDQKNDQVSKGLIGVNLEADNTRYTLQDAALYFSNDTDKLSLITKNDPSVKTVDTISTDTIKELFPDSSKRITYYDQLRTTGANIFQHDSGFVFVILGLKTTSMDLYQAIMRMRKFMSGQRLIFIVPRSVAEAINGRDTGRTLTVEDVVDFTEKNLQKAVIELNSMALVQMIVAAYKEAVYIRCLNGILSFQRGELELWIKSTSSNLEELIVPMRDRSFKDEIIPAVIKQCEGKLRHALTADELDRIREDVNSIIRMAFTGNSETNPLYKTASLCASPGANEKTGGELSFDMASDTDQVAIATVETESNLKVETESLTDAYVKHVSKAYMKRVDYAKPKMRFDRYRYSSSDDFTRLTDIIPTVFLRHLRRDVGLPSFFNPGIFVSSAFLDSGALFGKHRNFALHCLLLQRDAEKRIIMVPPLDARKIRSLLESESREGKIFGYDACLLDPKKMLVSYPQWSDKDLHAFRGMIADALIFAGYINEISKECWKGELDRWLGVLPEERATKAVLLTRVILTEEENKKSKHIFAGTNFDDYMQVSTDLSESAHRSHEIFLLEFWTRNRLRLSEYFGALQVGKPDFYLRKMVEIYLVNTEMELFSQDELSSVILPGVRGYLKGEENQYRVDWKATLDTISVLFDVCLHSNYLDDPTKVAVGKIMFEMAQKLLTRHLSYADVSAFVPLFKHQSKVIDSMSDTEEGFMLVKPYLEALPESDLLIRDSELFISLIPMKYRETQEELTETLLEAIFSRPEFDARLQEDFLTHFTSKSSWYLSPPSVEMFAENLIISRKPGAMLRTELYKAMLSFLGADQFEALKHGLTYKINGWPLTSLSWYTQSDFLHTVAPFVKTVGEAYVFVYLAAPEMTDKLEELKTFSFHGPTAEQDRAAQDLVQGLALDIIPFEPQNIFG